MCAGLTIWSASRLVKDAHTIAITGAGGGLGHLGLQFAAHLGKSVLAVDAEERPAKLLEALVGGLGDVNAADHVTIIDSR